MKLLIISLSAGAGHVRAAEAIKKTAEQSFPSIEVKHIDMADYISLTMKKTVITSYAMMVKTVPELYGYLYNKANTNKSANRLNKLTKQLKRINSVRLYSFIDDYKPDIILCTHFLATDVILGASQKRKIDSPVNTLITDYDLHNLWVVPNTNHYFVATKKIEWKMMRQDVQKNKITISGIPIDPIFYKEKSIDKLREDYKIKPNKKVVLVMSGGQGMGKAGKIVKMLTTSSQPLSIIAIAGKNKHLEKRLKKIKVPSHIDLYSIGWTDKVDDYMRLADIIITKSGGVTTTECITLGKPMIIIDPIPGQEEQNADYILSNNLGFIARNTDDLLYYVEQDSYQTTKITPKNSAKIILENLE
ncbi:glycosyltransferase [Patescibacteria group bacterium]|nr:glycosyltransferase [Patescibacteria group bacterium]MBU1896104.1 glycosyltransferase [Patescibacteria group bacterium]